MLAVIWTWWIGVILAAGTFLTIAAIVVGYLVQVESKRYSKKP